ncbi:MAG: FAD-dependent thymidylate synthase [Candidatus Pacebacteria bacterium]|jgi:thymidylate synthase ThyX|nr:FAD-dependent thymidylate synthase [Candidatus Paceibacterota bacterium]
MEEILFKKPEFTEEEKYYLEPFFTNLDKSVYAVVLLPPEVIGALSSRASRSKDDLRALFLNEFVKPFLESEYGKAWKNFIDFLHQYNYEILFANPKARDFYIKWLAEYGDDSIAQMAGTHLIFSSLSQVAIKHFENQRIGIAPIEKSTRYVDFGEKVNNHYLYFLPPEVEKAGLKDDYEKVMDTIFEFYISSTEKYFNYLKEKYPEEKERVLKAKTFDECRRILPLATLGQVSFFGNGQAFEYLINRSLANPLEEIRWAGKRAYEELSKVIPAFLRRIEKEESINYQKYLGERNLRLIEVLEKINWKEEKIDLNENVRLLAYDEDGENKIIAGLLYPLVKEPFDFVLNKVSELSLKEKEEILEKILKERKYRWQKMPRALELVYLKFEIKINIGAWRDLQRHRMQTLINKIFSIEEGFEVPSFYEEIGLKKEAEKIILLSENLYEKLKKINIFVSQYSVLFLHKIRFLQYQNLREFFWEVELRTTPQGHPDYRKVEQEKARIIQKIYPLISKYLFVDFNEYEFARRGEEEKIKEKRESLKKFLEKS